MKLNILALSYLFPSSAQPNYGIFVYNRLRAVQEFCSIFVISPVQWYPFIGKARSELAGFKAGCAEQNFQGVPVAYPRFPVVPRYFKWLDSIFFLLGTLPVFWRLVKQKKQFDLVDVHWTYPDILAGYVLAKLLKKPFLVTIRGREALHLGEKGGRKKILDYFLKKADGVVTLSSELRDLVVKIGVNPDKVKIILNGVNPKSFLLQNKEEARQKLGLLSDKKIVVTVGSLIPRKGHHELIRMWPNLGTGDDIDLYIIGGASPEGNYGDRLRDMIFEQGLKNIHLVDSVPHVELVNWYGAADIFCLATRGEGCPNVVLEALACGTPVVVTDVGAVRDLVASGENGFVVNSMDEMQVKITEALNTVWDRLAIADKMRSRTWRVCAEEVLDAYRSVIGRSDIAALEGGER